jgi:hypothetical protein
LFTVPATWQCVDHKHVVVLEALRWRITIYSNIFIFMTVTNNIYQKQIKYHVFNAVTNSELTELVPVFTIKINKIKKHDVPDLYRSLHRIRFYSEFRLQFRQHGNVSIIKMWSFLKHYDRADQSPFRINQKGETMHQKRVAKSS